MRTMKALAVLGILAMFAATACKDKNDVTDLIIDQAKKIESKDFKDKYIKETKEKRIKIDDSLKKYIGKTFKYKGKMYTLETTSAFGKSGRNYIKLDIDQNKPMLVLVELTSEQVSKLAIGMDVEFSGTIQSVTVGYSTYDDWDSKESVIDLHLINCKI